MKAKQKFYRTEMESPFFFGKEMFKETLLSSDVGMGSINQLANNIQIIIATACDAFSIKRLIRKRPCYWWTDNIRLLRMQCLKARRSMQRGTSRPDFFMLLENFKGLQKKKIEP